eukprot:CAMPEP_0113617342 /NCGR_PEP_ID=MMETSP0017_2-20120614/8726_1 /TAXON_ID=2856 /ORGANISM="Cylindrotheca closterium" /LENGTH=220 /DNA_ID=CAMNT_0000526725 /DNA_START=203 /DNA_END=865 /DNA_ORIENTATION=- /assembly_acc=CAM_ASM_000147
MNFLPSSQGGSPDHGDQLQQQGQIEFHYDPAYGIKTPEPNDIVCGRGKMTVAHPGNRRFRRLVNNRKEDYQKARRRDHKTRITLELVQELRGGPDGGRFLLYDTRTRLWYEVGDGYAREKISHSLRSRPSEQRRAKPKPRKRVVRKPAQSPYLESLVQRLIADQQALLKSMIAKETQSELSAAAGLEKMGQEGVVADDAEEEDESAPEEEEEEATIRASV